MILTLLKGYCRVSEPRWVYYVSYTIVSHPQLHPHRKVSNLFCPLKLWLYYLQGEERHMKLSPQKHSPLRLLILVTLHFSHHFSEIQYVKEGGYHQNLSHYLRVTGVTISVRGMHFYIHPLPAFSNWNFVWQASHCSMHPHGRNTLQPSARADTNLLKLIIIIIWYRMSFIYYVGRLIFRRSSTAVAMIMKGRKRLIKYWANRPTPVW